MKSIERSTRPLRHVNKARGARPQAAAGLAYMEGQSRCRQGLAGACGREGKPARERGWPGRARFSRVLAKDCQEKGEIRGEKARMGQAKGALGSENWLFRMTCGLRAPGT